VKTDRAVKDLAALLGAISAAAEEPSALERLLNSLLNLTPFFTGAVLFTGYGGGAFVATASRSMSAPQTRAWLGWPLRRLFIRMKPSRIFDPAGSGREALAIPFAHGSRRWVALAALRDPAELAPHDDFFQALESITIPANGPAFSPHVRTEIVPVDPAIASFALSDDIHRRLLAAVSTRAWPLERIESFGALARRLQDSVPDIIAVDLRMLREPMSAIARIHRIADYGALRILAFGTPALPHHRSSVVVDRFLPHDASEEVIFKSIKDLANEGAFLRRNLAREEHVFSRRLSEAALTFQEIADLAAEKAAAIMGGWGCCFLLNGAAIYRAENPLGPQPVFRCVPNNFLSGLSAFDAEYRSEFLDELTGDPSERLVFEGMQPLSASTIVLVSETGRHLGVLVACSTERRAGPESFEALEALAAIIVGRFGRLVQSDGHIPQLQKERLWERLHDGMLRLDVYRSSDCSIPWRYRFVSETRGLLTLNLDENAALTHRLLDGPLDGPSLAKIVAERRAPAPFFVAGIDFSAHTIDFATQGFSPPILLNHPGPGTLIAATGGIATGSAELHSAANAVVCDGALWNWLRSRPEATRHLDSALDREAPAGMASIITLD
jgi:hypothetical protein